MAQVSRLRCDEAMALDPARLVVLYAELGQDAAERVISAAMEDLAGHLNMLEDAATIGHRTRLRRTIAEICVLAEQVGLTSMVRVARHLAQCVEQDDPIAQSAVMARLGRIAERSLTEVWDLGDLSS
ncbi:hypothetical protein [Thioclava pacifica]|uniref:HPt domain-containing protein n=1 Tax=Thioclava pacifica DSM 10166 TaxID=1353537 RepID=A0A074J1C8_9RHOB|nr:hypothetical protein [Thioclava pacifica]KEO51166.1 hypothetical protein TP2_12280 [Thioclava pacifica DSM 10166]